MQVLIPVRFYGFDSIMYIASAIIGFFVSYYAYRLFDISSKKSHFYFFMSFTILSMALMVIGITSGLAYLNYFIYHTTPPLLDALAYVDDFGYWIYYIASFAAYCLLAYTYLPERVKFPILIPFWYSAFPYFNVISLFLLSYITFRCLINYVTKRTLNSLLVALAFTGIILYHFFLLFTSISTIVYLTSNFSFILGKFLFILAHLSLMTGFLSLLAMLIRVNRSER